MALFTLVIKGKPTLVQNHREYCAALFALLKINVALGRSKHRQRKAHAFRGRPTLKDVKRQLQKGSFRDSN